MAAESKQQIFSIILMRFSELGSSVPATFNWLRNVHGAPAASPTRNKGEKNSSFGVGAGLISKKKTAQKVLNISLLFCSVCQLTQRKTRKRLFFKKKKRCFTHTIKNIERAEGVLGANVSPANHRVPRDDPQP